MFKNNKPDLFSTFLEDTLDKLQIITLSNEKYKEIASVNNQYKLDFDDTYQFLVAQGNLMTIVTQDADFRIVENVLKVQFL